jgi:uncharacterized membrane protein
MNSVLFVLAVLSGSVAFAEWLATKKYFRYLGGALLVILLCALWANLGIIPSASDPSPIYGSIFSYLAPLAIFYLLLEVNIKSVLKAGKPMIILFLLGSLGTCIGVLVGMSVINARENMGAFFYALGGMFAGTYTGGSINFNAVALHYNIAEQGALYTTAIAVDNIITTLWMGVTIVLPRMMRVRADEAKPSEAHAKASHDWVNINPEQLGILLVLGITAFLVSEWIGTKTGVPSILVITTIALALAQLPVMQKLEGSRLLGMFSISLFLAVIGAYCDIGTLLSSGQLAIYMSVFVGLMIITHGAFLFGMARIMRSNWILVSIASQANIGGSTSALALARSFNRSDLVLPAILVGTLGNGLGTYLGFMVAALLQQYA